MRLYCERSRQGYALTLPPGELRWITIRCPFELYQQAGRSRLTESSYNSNADAE